MFISLCSWQKFENYVFSKRLNLFVRSWFKASFQMEGHILCQGACIPVKFQNNSVKLHPSLI